MVSRALERLSKALFPFTLVLLLTGCGGGSKPPPPPSVTDINGGVSGSGTVGSLFVIDGNNFGDLSAQTPGYSVDFRDATSDAVVASASVNFTVGDWQNIVIVATVPNGVTALTTYKVTVTTPGGTSAPLNFLVLSSVPFSPSTMSWTQTSPLPAAQQGFPTVIVPIITTTSGTATTASYIYTLGGNTASAGTGNKASNVDTIYYNVIDNSTGSLPNAWTTSSTLLPFKRGFAAAVTANSFNSLVTGNGNIYVLGGLDDTGSAADTVYYASLKTDGTIPAAGTTGTWTATTKLPKALYAEGAVIFHGNIYVVGGNDSTNLPVSNVYSAKINSDGTLGAWQSQPDLPVALAYHQLVTAAGYLYVLGGDTGNLSPIDPITNAMQTAYYQYTLYYNQINIRTGALLNTPWMTNANSIGKNREKFAAIASGSNIFINGGLYNGASSASSESSYATINADGSVQPFGGAKNGNTIDSLGGYNPYNHSAAYFVDSSGNPHVLILGGADVGTGTAETGAFYQ
jgi:hypothetical protein